MDSVLLKWTFFNTQRYPILFLAFFTIFLASMQLLVENVRGQTPCRSCDFPWCVDLFSAFRSNTLINKYLPFQQYQNNLVQIHPNFCQRHSDQCPCPQRFSSCVLSMLQHCNIISATHWKAVMFPNNFCRTVPWISCYCLIVLYFFFTYRSYGLQLSY